MTLARIAPLVRRLGRATVVLSCLALLVMVNMVVSTWTYVHLNNAQTADRQRLSDVLDGKISINAAVIDGQGHTIANLAGEIAALQGQVAALSAGLDALAKTRGAAAQGQPTRSPTAPAPAGTAAPTAPPAPTSSPLQCLTPLPPLPRFCR